MVNLPTAGTDYHVPFGGVRASSYGPREQGRYAHRILHTGEDVLHVRWRGVSAMLIDALQFGNWSRAIFEQMRAAGLSAVHATVAYHEGFRPTVDRIVAWNARFREHADLILPGRAAADLSGRCRPTAPPSSSACRTRCRSRTISGWSRCCTNSASG